MKHLIHKVKSHHVAIGATALIVGVALGMGVVENFTSAA